METPTKAAYEIQRAFEALTRGRLDAAETACREILSRTPSDVDATHMLGLVRKESAGLEEGERLLRASIQLAPKREDFRANLANLLVRRGDLREAEAPGCDPQRFVEPRPGRLVLFPSYMWHGTNPLRNNPIENEDGRISIAFDAVPNDRNGRQPR